MLFKEVYCQLVSVLLILGGQEKLGQAEGHGVFLNERRELSPRVLRS